MKDTPSAPPVPPGAYTEEYFRRGVEGHEQFAASAGRALSPRLAHALRLARVRPGERVLDIACGRGEIVLQSALLGARALGIDYAQAALSIARPALAGTAGRAALARMDATRLALRDSAFDVALLLDFVEHVHQPELERAFAQVARALRPGGRVVVHTSPNRVFEELVWPHYVRNVHRAVLGITRLLRARGRLFNELVLPAGPLPPHDEFERALHVNPQSAGSLRAALRRAGFRVQRIEFWEPPRGRFFPPGERWRNLAVGALDAVRFLRPLSLLPPLNRLFSNHVWVVGEKR